MHQELPHLPSPSDWERRKPTASTPPRRRLTLTPVSPILEVVPLEQGRGLRLVGELCLSSVGDLLTALGTLPEGADVLDLGDLSFMDSSGLHAFERYARSLKPRPLVLQNAPAHVRRLFALTGADLNPDIKLRNDGDHG
jgi:anti-anti-sigma regulatory factor